MKRKILKFLGLALYSDLKNAQNLTNVFLDKIEFGEQFKVLKQDETLSEMELSNVILRHPNSTIKNTHVKGSLFIMGKPYGNAENAHVLNNIIEPTVVN